MNDYTYVDSMGTKHCTTTDTSPLPVENGAMYRDIIKEGGDHTRSKKKVLPLKTLGTSRI